ncbi:WAT1-related protein At5g07050-like [Prosopis cineraria]|uniref:WAT1-related protein At5g07050-like n=1 Tax=Prosopis cineraria TaxID=364024 RepID=UPI00240FF09E|nr:WAT1-related protein At5g07050-like [Prosopis cineraria]
MVSETKLLGCCGRFLESSKHHFATIALQFGYAGMNVITKVSLNRGMSHYVLVVYRHAFATAVIAPFAFIYERKAQPKITFPIFMQIFILALLGPVIDQNFYYAGLKFTSPTFSCAMSNILPAMTFVMAVLCRMEKINMKKMRCQAKVVGTIVTVAGAMLMTLYKGPIVELLWTKHYAHRYSHITTNNLQTTHTSTSSSDKQWFIGSIFLIIATFAWACLFIEQAKALETYKNHNLSLTSLMCFIGTLQAIAVTFVMEHNPSVWKIGFDMNLLAAAYAGIVTSSLTYYVQGLVINKKGPVFATAFSPLMMIIVAIMGSFILAEKIYLGGVIGSILIVIGLYSVLWGKHKERVESKVNEVDQDIALPMKASPVDANNNNNNNNKYADDKQLTINEAKSEKGDKSISKIDSVHISMPHSNQEPKA